jgi:hypothetical protein
MYLCLHSQIARLESEQGRVNDRARGPSPPKRFGGPGYTAGFGGVHMQTKAGAHAPNIDFASRTALAASLRIPFHATPSSPAAPVTHPGKGVGDRGTSLAPAPGSSAVAAFRTAEAPDPRVSEPGAAVSALQTHLGFAGLAHSGAPAEVPQVPANPRRGARPRIAAAAPATARASRRRRPGTATQLPRNALAVAPTSKENR